MRFYSADYAPESQILLRFTLWIVHHKSSEWPGSRQKHSILLQGTKTNFFLKSRKNIAYFLYQGSKAQHNYPFTHDVLQSRGKAKRGGYMNQSTPKQAMMMMLLMMMLNMMVVTTILIMVLVNFWHC